MRLRIRRIFSGAVYVVACVAFWVLAVGLAIVLGMVFAQVN